MFRGTVASNYDYLGFSEIVFLDNAGNAIEAKSCFAPSHKSYDLAPLGGQSNVVSNACDNNPQSEVIILFKTTDTSGGYAEVEFEFQSPVRLYGYRICTHTNSNFVNGDPEAWDVHAKLSKPDDKEDMDEQGDWVNLDTVENGNIAAGGSVPRASCATSAFELTYKAEVYMLKIDTVRSESPMQIDLAEVVAYKSDGDSVTPTAVYSGNDKQATKEYLTKGVRSLIDKSENTKWRTIVSNTACIVFTFPHNIKPEKHQFVSGDEFSARDPKSWQWLYLEQGNDGTAAFSTQYLKVENFAGAPASLTRKTAYPVGPNLIFLSSAVLLNTSSTL